MTKTFLGTIAGCLVVIAVTPILFSGAAVASRPRDMADDRGSEHGSPRKPGAHRAHEGRTLPRLGLEARSRVSVAEAWPTRGAPLRYRLRGRGLGGDHLRRVLVSEARPARYRSFFWEAMSSHRCSSAPSFL